MSTAPQRDNRFMLMSYNPSFRIDMQSCTTCFSENKLIYNFAFRTAASPDKQRSAAHTRSGERKRFCGQTHLFISAFRPCGCFFWLSAAIARCDMVRFDGIKSRIAFAFFYCESRLSESLNHNQ